jgi:hypothetical protein
VARLGAKISAVSKKARPAQVIRQDLVCGAELPEALHEAIENARDVLAQAQSVLQCLEIALERHSKPQEPYFPDIARIASDLVKRAFNALDSLNLERAVKESLKPAEDQ